MKSNIECDIDKNAFNVALGKRLCMLRIQHKKSQSYVGEKLGVSYQQIYKYETGESQISPSQLLIYAKLFNVSMAYLYGITNQTNDEVNQSAEIQSLPHDIRVTIFELARQIKNRGGNKA